MTDPRDPATTRPDDSRREFFDRDLRGARFVRVDLSGAVLSAVDVRDTDIDAPWLGEDESSLRVNGVDVVPYVEAELDRRFPGRSERRAGDPDGLRAAWSALERAWAVASDHVAAGPPGSADVSVAGEWSFAQTLRHLVTVTDIWLRWAILGVERPFSPLGMPAAEYAIHGYDTSVFAAGTPAYADVLEARADRVALVRDFLASVTPEELAAPRRNPLSPEHEEATLSCLHTILQEEWEHLRFAVRDLDAIAAGAV